MHFRRLVGSRLGARSNIQPAEAFTSAAPLVLVLDDLQWADGDSIEWLHHFVRSGAGSRCLNVATVRAEEEQDNPPLLGLLRQLEHDRLMTIISLGPLDRTATAQLAGQVAEQPLDESALAQTFRETEGHPLFIIERGRMALTDQAGAGDRGRADFFKSSATKQSRSTRCTAPRCRRCIRRCTSIRSMGQRTV